MRSPSAVDPLRSENRTVTVLRGRRRLGPRPSIELGPAAAAEARAGPVLRTARRAEARQLSAAGRTEAIGVAIRQTATPTVHASLPHPSAPARHQPERSSLPPGAEGGLRTSTGWPLRPPAIIVTPCIVWRGAGSSLWMGASSSGSTSCSPPTSGRSWRRGPGRDRRCGAQRLEGRGEAPTDEEVEEASNRWRYDHDLISADDLESWLSARELGLDEWLGYIGRT